MRSIVGGVFAVFFLVAAAEASAQSATPTPTPVPVAEDEMPTVEDDAAAVSGEGGDFEGSRGRTYILGLRGGIHAFEPGGIAGDGGLALEFTGAVPISGPFYAAGSVGYRTGFYEVNGNRSFFDAQFGSVEGQYRMNLGPVNAFGGLGLGFLVGNTAEIVANDGAPITDSGTGAQAHVIAGAHLPVGRFGVVSAVKYGFAPVEFQESKETVPMGGLTLLVGMDFPF